MKTPRELLLDRHRAAAPRLDAIRVSVLASAAREAVPLASVNVAATCCLTLWRELFLPCRRIWNGLAIVWLVLIALNLAQHDFAAKNQPAVAVPRVMSLRAQQKLLGELMAERPPGTMDMDRPRSIPPKPRTETCQSSLT